MSLVWYGHDAAADAGPDDIETVWTAETYPGGIRTYGGLFVTGTGNDAKAVGGQPKLRYVQRCTLRKAWQALGLTREQAAERLGMTEARLCDILSGRLSPRTGDLPALRAMAPEVIP